jgi:hypothetical protein
MKQILAGLLSKRPRNYGVDQGLNALSKIYGFGNRLDRKFRLDWSKKVVFDKPTIRYLDPD